jgi:hypothetical protein
MSSSRACCNKVLGKVIFVARRDETDDAERAIIVSIKPTILCALFMRTASYILSGLHISQALPACLSPSVMLRCN